MPENLPAENPLTVSAHPVIRVYCNGEGIVCYERDGAETILLNEVSPDRSRSEARRRCKAMLLHVSPVKGEIDLQALGMHTPISATGVGLTYRQLAEQTVMAINKSKIVEQERLIAFAEKRKRYRS